MPKPVSSRLCAFILILISMSGHGCSSNSKIARGSLDSLARTKLGSAYSVTYNESKSYVLCQQASATGDHALRAFKFIVVKVSDNTIKNEGSYRNGYAKWINDKSIEVRSAGMDEKSETKILTINDQQS
jgi:hypothetical protein